jgi:HEAT repeat protein
MAFAGLVRRGHSRRPPVMTNPAVTNDELRRSFAGPGEKHQLQLIESLDASSPVQLGVMLDMWRTEDMPSILRWVARALCRFRSSEATSSVAQALAHPNMSVRLHAVSGIWKHRRTEFVPDLRVLVNDQSGSVRLRTLSALSAMNADGVQALLEAALDDPKEYVRRFAKRALSPANSGTRS